MLLDAQVLQALPSCHEDLGLNDVDACRGLRDCVLHLMATQHNKSHRHHGEKSESDEEEKERGK